MFPALVIPKTYIVLIRTVVPKDFQRSFIGSKLLLIACSIMEGIWGVGRTLLVVPFLEAPPSHSGHLCGGESPESQGASDKMSWQSDRERQNCSIMCNSCWKRGHAVGPGSESASAGFLPQKAIRSIPVECELRSKVKCLCEEGRVLCVSRSPLVLTCCGCVWCRHSLCRPALWLKSVWNLMGLFLESCTVTDIGHNGWSDFSIVCEQKDPKDTRWWLPVDPLLVWLQWCGVGGLLGLLGSWPGPERSSGDQQTPDSASISNWNAVPCLLVVWMASLCEPKVCHRLCPAYRRNSFCLKLFTCGPKTHCSPKVTLEIRYSASCSDWTSHYSNFYGFERRWIVSDARLALSVLFSKSVS